MGWAGYLWILSRERKRKRSDESSRRKKWEGDFVHEFFVFPHGGKFGKFLLEKKGSFYVFESIISMLRQAKAPSQLGFRSKPKEEVSKIRKNVFFFFVLVVRDLWNVVRPKIGQEPIEKIFGLVRKF